jgi:hypothetical protein
LEGGEEQAQEKEDELYKEEEATDAYKEWMEKKVL